MLSHLQRLTKLFSILSITTLAMAVGMPLASAIIPMDTHNIDAAIVYGMKNQKLGIANILGPNWIENEDGALLNVYTPFMVLATKAARGNYPINPTKSDLKAARKKFGKYTAFYMDPNNRHEVKFAVSFYGDSPTFAKTYEARIEGTGRGKEFSLKPTKRYPDQIADPVKNGLTQGKYEAINSYYFKLSDVINLDEFRLILESPNGKPISFRIRGDRLY